jgi:hypothetical protein
MKNSTVAILTVLSIVLLVLLAWGFPQYRIYSQQAKGEAELKEAEWTRKISIEEAKAKKESAVLEAEAEVERAKGVAQANKIIGTSLEGNEAYLRYLFINQLGRNENDVIYIPTEAGLPILEAGKNVPPKVTKP